MEITFKLVVALLCTLLVAIFAVQNSSPVIVGFLKWRFEISLALVILGATALGAVFVFLLGIFQQISQGLKLREYRNKAQYLERELAQARQRLQELMSAEDEEPPPEVQENAGETTGPREPEGSPGLSR